MNRWRRWRRLQQYRRCRQRGPDFRLWLQVSHRLDLLRGLTAGERVRLRALSFEFLQAKTITGVQGLEVTETMALCVAAQACLPILNLGLDYYRGWVEVVLYPGTFAVEHEEQDETGVVSTVAELREGETWPQGPVILSWAELQQDLEHPEPGYNVVVHEFAHKLDMLEGGANGLPPLHRDMSVARWAQVMERAFRCLQAGEIPAVAPSPVPSFVQGRHARPVLDDYGARDPAEFFAVASEAFFTDPGRLYAAFPEVYEQLARFYRQDPRRRRT